MPWRKIVLARGQGQPSSNGLGGAWAELDSSINESPNYALKIGPSLMEDKLKCKLFIGLLGGRQGGLGADERGRRHFSFQSQY